MKKSTARKRLISYLVFLFMTTLVSVVLWTTNVSAEGKEGSVYMEVRGSKADVYAVKDILSLDRPYSYVIGSTTIPTIEILGALAALGAIGFSLMHGLGRLIANRKNPLKLEEVGEEYIYALFTRVWHWLNAITILGLLVTGFQMHYSGPEHIYGIGHNWFAYFLVVEYLCFLAYEFATRDFKQFIPASWEFTEGLIKQAKFYAIGIFKQEEHPYHMVKEHRLNPMQKPAYLSVMFGLLPVIIITGLILMRPDLMSFLISWIGGQENVKYVFYLHLISAFGALAFLMGHLYLATTGDTVRQHFEVMLTGFHRVYKHHRS
ncbi:MAG: cytochrome b/b6 domain-containing protein [SAR324 cluster bacterium]|nr:cytochrome b/b6 domain-containing protein [SAR324 cluster bacterium]